jgi:S-adenosylmethionine decarboxylase
MRHLMFTAMYDKPRSDEEVVSVFFEALDAAGAHLRDRAGHSFYPKGVTTQVVLAESSAGVHTYPEYGFALVDYFSCSADPKFETFQRHWEHAGFRLDEVEVIERAKCLNVAAQMES